ncbi:MAG: VOC family protein [Myxococcales bacterium]|nr:VOC family protein [Myxococcales bacterium]MCB9732013.1 VOC family protein [Deltaproteobacteria bacterium]
MIDHVSLNVTDIAAAKAFYAAALAPLGYTVMMDYGVAVGLGADGKPDFWLAPGGGARPLHIAFRAQSREQVRAFHAAALAAGGKDNGAPGIRAQYHPSYYGAFVHDADGNNVEAVTHTPE